MSATTRWRDNQANSIEEVCEKMLSKIVDDERTNSIYWKNISCRKVFDEIQTTSLNGSEIRYISLHYRYDQISAQEDPKDDRYILKNGLIIIYQHKSTVFYIVDQNSSAKNFLENYLHILGKMKLIKIVLIFQMIFLFGL